MLTRIVNGDKDAFEEFYLDYKGKIYRIIISILGSSQNVEDIFQDVLILLYKNFRKLRNIEKVDSWAYRIIFNCCMKYINKESKLKMISLDETKDLDCVSIIQDKNDDSIQDIDAVLYNLPTHYKIPILLFYYHDKSIKEISILMKCSQGTIKSRLFNGKKILRNKLKQTQIPEFLEIED